MKELKDLLKGLTEEQLRELAENLCNRWLEAYICDDGYLGYREKGSRGDFEDEILGTLTLSPEYWRDSVIEWGVYDEEGDGIDEDADWSTVRDFITEWVLPEFKETNFRYPGDDCPWLEGCPELLDN